jgi:hypothetical protein
MNLRSSLFWAVMKHMLVVVYKHLGQPISPIFLECITNRMSQSVSDQLSSIAVKTTCRWHWKPKISHRCTCSGDVHWPHLYLTIKSYYIFPLCTRFSVHKRLCRLGNVSTIRTKSSVFMFCKFIESTICVLYFGGQGFGADTPVALRHHQLYLSALCLRDVLVHSKAVGHYLAWLVP